MVAYVVGAGSGTLYAVLDVLTHCGRCVIHQLRWSSSCGCGAVHGVTDDEKYARPWLQRASNHSTARASIKGAPSHRWHAKRVALGARARLSLIFTGEVWHLVRNGNYLPQRIANPIVCALRFTKFLIIYI